MAALQKIRSNTWIIAIMGVGLFLFILTMVLDQNTISAITSGGRTVGEVYGKSLSQEEFYKMVNEASEVQKFRSGGSLTDEQTEQVRDQVWNEFVSFELIKHECDKLGLIVTDEEVKQALREGTAQSFQNVPMFMGQDGRFNYTALQGFLKQAKEMKGKQVDSSVAEQIATINSLWAYTEKQLRRELLMNKYQALFVTSFTSNPVSAKVAFNDRTVSTNTQVAALPFASISDKEVKVEDSDLKAAYDQYKELFRLDNEVRDIKYIDVNVTASAADKKVLNNEMNVIFGKLQAGEDPAAVINASKSAVRFANVPLSTSVFPSDIKAELDSMGAGATKAPYLNVQDNTMNIVKVISKVQAPDSILYRALPVQAADAKAAGVRADSILNALNSGAKYADIAKKAGVPSDSSWIAASQFESTEISADNAKFVNALYNAPLKGYTQLEIGGNKIILQVLDRKAMKSKVVAAVVKIPVDFSKATYDAAVSKFNRFLAENHSLADIVKNAPKAGYQVIDQDGFSSSNRHIGGNGQFPGIAGSKDAVRWVFDTAEEGELSPLYEVGEANNHLLVVALDKVYKKGYMPWDNKQVKEFLTAVVKSQKKGEVAAKKLAGVKTIEAAKAKGAVVDSLNNVTFSGYAVVPAVGAPEPMLTAAISTAKVGQTTAPIIGTAGAYVAKIVSRNKGTEKFDAKLEMNMTQRSYMQAAQQVLGALARKADIVDHRYKF